MEDAYAQAFPQGLTRYPVATCAAMTDRLARLYDPSLAGPSRRLSPDEDAFIASERLLTKIDFRYWAERYCWINAAGTHLQRLTPLWESQEIILGEFARIQDDRLATGHPDGILINILKARQLGACLDPETRVLTADLRWVPLGSVEVGDALVATDEDPPGGRGAGRHMRTAVVEAQREVQADAFELVFDTGVRVIATGEHRWLTRNRGGTDTKWRQVQKMIVGDVVRYITKPWGAPTFEDGWMAGMLDGEGSCAVRRAGVEVMVCQVYGPVYDRATHYFEDRGYASFHHERPDKRTPENSSKFGRRPVGKVSIARMDEIFRLLGTTRPTRFINRRWWEGKELPGKRNGFGWARVVEIRPVGQRRMIDLQTSTKTYIAEGLVSHNSTLGSALIMHRVTTQAHVRALLASDVPDNSGSEGLFGMYERILANLPWWLRPEEQFHTKSQHVIFTSGSAIFVESGKSMKGGLMEKGATKGSLGRSRTYSTLHLTELSSWDRPEQVDDSLLPAVPRSARTLAIKESTAKGRHNWHHEDWLVGERGQGRFTNCFIPWYAEVRKNWLPAPASWTPAEETLAHARKAEQDGPKWLHRPVSLTREQLRWYEEERAMFASKGQLAKFLEEQASNPEEAFQHSGRSIFTLDQLQYLAHLARPPIDVWTVAPAKDLSLIRQAELSRLAERQAAQSAADEAKRRRPLDIFPEREGREPVLADGLAPLLAPPT